MLEHETSLRSVARVASIPPATLSTWMNGKMQLSNHASARLIRAIDGNRHDLSVRAAELYKSLKRSAYTADEILAIGQYLTKMGQALQPLKLNTPEHS